MGMAHASPQSSNSGNIVEIALDSIEWRDLSTFIRCGVDGDQVENLKAAYTSGTWVPPVTLFAERTVEDGSKEQKGTVRYYIGDGWHRFHALRELGRAVIPAIVHEGGRREALKCALGANTGFGLRRTNKDKRKAVEVAIREFPRLSSRAVAELCKVSHEMVNALRSQLADSASCRVGRDGKTRHVAERDTSEQLDFFELLGREWAPVMKSFDLTIESVAWLDNRVVPEKKLEAISAMRKQLDDMRCRLAERERAIKAGMGNREPRVMGNDGAEGAGT
jgi:uncharacterized ParB-like nuclease family protein